MDSQPDNRPDFDQATAHLVAIAEQLRGSRNIIHELYEIAVAIKVLKADVRDLRQ